MSHTVTLDEAGARLRELVRRLAPGDEVVITENARPVAKLVAEAPPPKPAPGFLKHMIVSIAPDFDAPLEDMREYMEP